MKKSMKQILSLLLVALMAVSLFSIAAFATSDVDPQDPAPSTDDPNTEAPAAAAGTGSITITLPTDNAGTDEEITYTVYKVFDATNDGSSSAISYKIDATNGELTQAMIDAGFSVDEAGNVSGPDALNADAIAAIAAYAQDLIGTYTAKPSDGTLTIDNLSYGYYYITTTTGTVVTIDSTNPNAEVEDKNTIPSPPDKKIVDGDDFVGSIDEAGQNALAQVGTTVYFEATITKVKGATNYVFHDTMSTGLEYNDDVTVTSPTGAVYDDTTAEGDTITLTFDNDWLASLADDTDIVIAYSATVTSDALTVDPANNTASLDYGEGHTTENDEVNVYNAKFTVTKQDGDGEPLEGAGFVVKNADDKYYHLEDGVVTWVDSIDDATEYTSDEEGAVTPFTGLADGTYTLVEKTVPEGYNKVADSTFTIAEGDYTGDNLEQESTVINNAGTELPSTGGIGTTIFYVVGSLLVVSAGVILVTKKRMGKDA